MGKINGKSRGDYSVADVIKVLRDGTALEQYAVTRFFPAFVTALVSDPLMAFSLAFGSKRADGAEYKLRLAIGVVKGDGEDGEGDEPAPEPEPAPAVESPAPEKPGKKSKAKVAEPAKPDKPDKPDKPAKEEKKGKSKDEDDIDALLNQLDDQVDEDKVKD